MINYKLFKWGYGVIVTLVVGLSSCYMDGVGSHENHQYPQNTMPAEKMSASKVKSTANTGKSYSSKEPAQKATPGPKRTEAPQLPVIQ